MRKQFLATFTKRNYAILPDVNTVFFLQSSNRPSNRAQFDGILRAAKSFGWNVRTLEFGMSSPSHRQHDHFVEFAENFRKMREFWNPIGIIVDSGAAPTGFRKDDFDLPTVFLDRHPATIGRGAVCVYSDAKSIAQCAARELLALNTASYAYVPFTDNLRWSVERGREFTAALRFNRIRCHIFRKGRSEVSDDAYLHELDPWIRELPKPAALFAANDYVGELVIGSARKNGFVVPDDIAVMGVDNDEDICLRCTPSLSSIKPDHERAGYLAATLLRDFIRHPRKPPKSQTFGALAVFHRSSTRALRRHDERTVKIVEIVRKQAASGITVEQLARDFGVTRRLIEMRFREATGHSIRNEIQSIRLERAKILLTQGKVRLSKIAATAGYPSVQAFRKTFTAATGKSPLNWRKAQNCLQPPLAI